MPITLTRADPSGTEVTPKGSITLIFRPCLRNWYHVDNKIAQTCKQYQNLEPIFMNQFLHSYHVHTNTQLWDGGVACEI